MRSERSERSRRAASRAPGGGGAPAGAAGGCACAAGARARHPRRQQCAPRNVRGARGRDFAPSSAGCVVAVRAPQGGASAATVHPRARLVAQRVPPLRGGGPRKRGKANKTTMRAGVASCVATREKHRLRQVTHRGPVNLGLRPSPRFTTIGC